MNTLIVLIITMTFTTGLVEKYEMPMPKAEPGECQVLQDRINNARSVNDEKVQVRALCVPTGTDNDTIHN